MRIQRTRGGVDNQLTHRISQTNIEAVTRLFVRNNAGEGDAVDVPDASHEAADVDV